MPKTRNLMKSYPGIDYSKEDPIANFLQYWLVPGQELDRIAFPEIKSAVADTVFSPWMIIKAALELEGRPHAKSQRGEILNHLDTWLPTARWSDLREFGALCECRENFWRLPAVWVNRARGNWYGMRDQLAPTLYALFSQGRFASCFEDDAEAAEWMNREDVDLDSVFEGGRIARSALRAPSKTAPAHVVLRFEKEPDTTLHSYIEYAIRVLRERRARLSSSLKRAS